MRNPSVVEVADVVRAARRERDLHIVAASQHPIALCGYVVSDKFDPNRLDTAGRDRCAECLKLFARIRGGSGA